MINTFFALVIFLIISFSVYIITIAPFILLTPRKKKLDYFKLKNIITDPGYYGIRYFNISFPTEENYCLKGWFLLADNPKATIIYLHGIGDSRYSHLEFMSLFVKHGYNVLMYDARAHGESEGLFCTYGFYEKNDVKCSIDFLAKEHFIEADSIIGLMGTSLGGAVALQALNVDNRIKFCITEAAFSDFQSTLDDYRSKGIFSLVKPFGKIIDKRIERLGNFQISAIVPKNYLSAFSGRVLLVHGAEDKKIYPEYFSHLAESAHAPEKLLLLDAGHNNIREKGGEDYIKQLLQFADNSVNIGHG